MAFIAGMVGRALAGGVARGVAAGAARGAAGAAAKGAVTRTAAAATTRQVAAKTALKSTNAIGARAFAQTQAGATRLAATATKAAPQAVKAAPARQTVMNTAQTAARQAGTTGAGKFGQVKAGVQAASRTPQWAEAKSTYRALQGQQAMAPQQQQRFQQQPGGGNFGGQGGSVTPPFHGGDEPSAFYNPGRGFGRGGTISPTEGGGSSFLRGGYKSLTGSEALTGVAQKSDYLPYEFGSGYRSSKWTAGRGFQQQGQQTDWGPPAANTRISDQKAIGPAQPMKAIDPTRPIPQPAAPTPRAGGERAAGPMLALPPGSFKRYDAGSSYTNKGQQQSLPFGTVVGGNQPPASAPASHAERVAATKALSREVRDQRRGGHPDDYTAPEIHERHRQQYIDYGRQLRR